MNTPLQPVCPKCGVALPPDAPKGLCPRCLAAMNLATETACTGPDALAAQPPLTPAELAPHFPQLEILECLGRGGMGVVYKARQKSLNRVVALKLLAPERVTDTKFAERFAQEAQALAALNHPHIVTIHDFGQAGGFYFLLMEFVDGVNLRQLLRSRKLTPEEALAIVPPLCDALQYAHDHGIVHRDIKPENLLLDREGRVKIADFGIAKMLGAEPSGTGITGAQPAGTPQYMAPEQQAAPHTADNRADIYSLGVVFYEMLTGELPAGKLQPPSRKVRIDVRLDEIVLRALEKTPELRFQTAADLRAEVETIATSGSKSAQSGTRAFPQWLLRPIFPERSKSAQSGTRPFPPVATTEAPRRWSFRRAALVVLSVILALPFALFVAYLVLGSYRTQRRAANETAGPGESRPGSARSVATNSGPLLVVDLWDALRPMGNPMQVRFQGALLDPAMLPEAERKASRPLLTPSAEATPWKIPWSVKPLSNLRSVGFLLPDTTSAQQAADQVNKLVNGHELRFRGAVELILFDLPKTSRGPYRAWVEFASREGAAVAPTESNVPSGLGVALARRGNHIVVGRILPNSPAAASGTIKEQDIILAAGQGDERQVEVTGRLW